jgi:hypothetical protein
LVNKFPDVDIYVMKEELHKLRDENTRLKALLTSHGIAWDEPPVAESINSISDPPSEPAQFTTADKIAFFRRLFRGRGDVYPQRWESTKGTSGYSPACGNE